MIKICIIGALFVSTSIQREKENKFSDNKCMKFHGSDSATSSCKVMSVSQLCLEIQLCLWRKGKKGFENIQSNLHNSVF